MKRKDANILSFFFLFYSFWLTMLKLFYTKKIFLCLSGTISIIHSVPISNSRLYVLTD